MGRTPVETCVFFHVPKRHLCRVLYSRVGERENIREAGGASHAGEEGGYCADELCCGECGGRGRT